MLYYVNSKGNVIAENEKYIGNDLKTYPARYPKTEIPELTPVKLTEKPVLEENQKITGFEVNDKKEQVWKVEEKSSEELNQALNDLKAYKRSEILSEYLNAKEDTLKLQLKDVDLSKSSPDLAAIGSEVVTLFQKYTELNETLQNALTLEEVKSVVWRV